MADELDKIDLEILRFLMRDGRAPVAQLAEEIGLTRPTVSERIERLEKQGVIRGTTVVVEPEALGRKVTAFVAARGPSLSSSAWRKFEELMNSDEIVEVHTVAGDDCYLIKVRTDSIQSLNTLVSQLSEAPLSMSTRTTIVMETHCEKVGGVRLGEKS